MADYVTLGKFALAVGSYMSWEQGITGLKSAWLDGAKDRLAFFPRVYSLVGGMGSFVMAGVMCYPILSQLTELSSLGKFFLLVSSWIFWEIGIATIKVVNVDSKKLKLSLIGQVMVMFCAVIAFGVAIAMCYPILNEFGVIDFLYSEFK